MYSDSTSILSLNNNLNCLLDCFIFNVQSIYNTEGFNSLMKNLKEIGLLIFLFLYQGVLLSLILCYVIVVERCGPQQIEKLCSQEDNP